MLFVPIYAVAPLYAEPHRFYHNTTHIHALIREIRSVCREENLFEAERQEVDLLEAAAWCHDAYYDPYAPPGLNEQISADISADLIKGNALRAAYIPKGLKPDESPVVVYAKSWVYDAVLATAHHTEDQDSLDFLTSLFLDIDLSGLGASSEVYLRNGANIRKEYPHTSDEDFNKGRIKWIEAMLSRKRIYYTDVIHRKYGVRAHLNLEEELQVLTNR